jgi:hypothetical protein
VFHTSCQNTNCNNTSTASIDAMNAAKLQYRVAPTARLLWQADFSSEGIHPGAANKIVKVMVTLREATTSAALAHSASWPCGQRMSDGRHPPRVEPPVEASLPLEALLLYCREPCSMVPRRTSL